MHILTGLQEHRHILPRLATQRSKIRLTNQELPLSLPLGTEPGPGTEEIHLRVEVIRAIPRRAQQLRAVPDDHRVYTE